MAIDLSQDGKTHINIYSRGATDLGRWLSNFAHTPFSHPQHGYFASVEAFWYWLGSHNEMLRHLHGYNAKKAGKACARTYDLPYSAFQMEIRSACWAKLWAHPNVLVPFAQSTLPFEHYYVFNGFAKDAGFKWLLEMWEQFRVEIRKHM